MFKLIYFWPVHNSSTAWLVGHLAARPNAGSRDFWSTIVVKTCLYVEDRTGRNPVPYAGMEVYTFVKRRNVVETEERKRKAT